MYAVWWPRKVVESNNGDGEGRRLKTIGLTSDSNNLPFAVIRPTEWQERTKQQATRRIFKVQWSIKRVKVIPIQFIVRAVSIVPIIGPLSWNHPYALPDSHREVDDMIYETRGFVLNNRVDDKTFNIYY